MTENIVSILSDAKAEDIKVIDLSNKSSVADAFVIATCRSTRHSDATADEMVKKLKRNEKTKKITKRKTDGTRNTI